MQKPNTETTPALSGAVTIEQVDAETAIVHFSGSWLLGADIKISDTLLADLAALPVSSQIQFKAIDLEGWDSRLATYILKLIDLGQKNSLQINVSELPEGVQGLLTLARAVPERAGDRRIEQQSSILASIGNVVVASIKDVKGLVQFIGEIVLAFFALLSGKARFRSVDIWLCLQEAGPSALPIVTLISLLVGLILAFVGALQLAKFGAQIYIADLVGLGALREMGALMTAVIMSGRTGAAYAAQLGTMNVNSEIDALKTMGISPIEFLVLPRMLALIVMLPLLCLYADFMGIIGGALVTISSFELSFAQYFHQIQRAIHLHDVGVGLVKSFVFAILIAIAGCMRGMQCGRSASAVGDAATSAVVNSIVYIVVADSILTLMFNYLKI